MLLHGFLFFRPYECLFGGQQSRVLNDSSHINGVRFPPWGEWAEGHHKIGYALGAVTLFYYLITSTSTQPELGPVILAKSPIWRRPREVFDVVDIASSSLKPEHIFQNSVTDCSVCSSISVCLQHQKMFGSKVCIFAPRHLRDSEQCLPARTVLSLSSRCKWFPSYVPNWTVRTACSHEWYSSRGPLELFNEETSA
jgi:hypothetical protein